MQRKGQDQKTHKSRIEKCTRNEEAFAQSQPYMSAESTTSSNSLDAVRYAPKDPDNFQISPQPDYVSTFTPCGPSTPPSSPNFRRNNSAAQQQNNDGASFQGRPFVNLQPESTVPSYQRHHSGMEQRPFLGIIGNVSYPGVNSVPQVNLQMGEAVVPHDRSTGTGGIVPVIDLNVLNQRLQNSGDKPEGGIPHRGPCFTVPDTNGNPR